jgi:hypothetical protein
VALLRGGEVVSGRGQVGTNAVSTNEPELEGDPLMRFTRTITALVAAITAALLGLTLAPTSAQAADSIQVQSSTAAGQNVAERGVTPREIVIVDCRCTTTNARKKPLWAKFATNPVAPGVKFKVFIKRNGKWRAYAKGKTNAAGVTKKFVFRAYGRKTKYKVVAKGDATYAKAIKKIPVTSSRY